MVKRRAKSSGAACIKLKADIGKASTKKERGKRLFKYMSTCRRSSMGKGRKRRKR